MKKILLISSALMLSLSIFAQTNLDSVDAEIKWKMEERYGLDNDNDGIIDIPNSPAYVQQSCFNVTLNAVMKNHKPEISVHYKWQITSLSNNQNVHVTDFQNQNNTTACLPEGSYKITLTVNLKTVQGDEDEFTVIEDIQINDLLIACIGDSYASGEGNPERRIPSLVDFEGTWADDGSGGRSSTFIHHHVAHRSSLAASSQFALEMEKTDPHTSVTFVFLASTGATIKKGLLGSQKSLDPQLDELNNLVGSRTIDALFVSIGGNDIGFSRAVTANLFYPNGETGNLPRDQFFDKMENCVRSGNWSFFRDYEINCEEIFGEIYDNGQTWPADLAGFDKLRIHYDEFITELQKLNIFNIYTTEYPMLGATGGTPENPEYCSKILSNVSPFFCNWGGADLKVGRSEIQFMDTAMAKRLNNIIEEIGKTNHFIHVKGIHEEFLNHGLCLDAAYNPADYQGSRTPVTVVPGNIRWGRRYNESKIIQNTAGGAVHPNEFGHAFIKQKMKEFSNLPTNKYSYNKDLYNNTMKTKLFTRFPVSLSFADEKQNSELISITDFNVHKFFFTKNETVRFKINSNLQLRFFDKEGQPINTSGNNKVKLVKTDIEGDSAHKEYLIRDDDYYFVGVSLKGNEQYDIWTGFGAQNILFRSENSTPKPDVQFPLRYSLITDIPKSKDADGDFINFNEARLGNTPGYGIENEKDVDFFEITITEPGVYSFEAETKINASNSKESSYDVLTIDTKNLQFYTEPRNRNLTSINESGGILGRFGHTRRRQVPVDMDEFKKHGTSPLTPEITIYDSIKNELAADTFKITKNLKPGKYFIKISPVSWAIGTLLLYQKEKQTFNHILLDVTTSPENLDDLEKKPNIKFHEEFEPDINEGNHLNFEFEVLELRDLLKKHRQYPRLTESMRNKNLLREKVTPIGQYILQINKARDNPL